MQCYDCQIRGVDRQAVAACTNCGAGVCAECVRSDVGDHLLRQSPGNPSHHRTRNLRCGACEAVLGVVNQASLSA